LAPYNVYPSADGHVAIICIREGHWRKLCQAMGQPELAHEDRFATTASRCQNMEALDELVNRWTRRHTKMEIFAIAQSHGVICAPVQDLGDVVNDPHLVARGTLERRAHPQLGEIAQCHTPLRFRDLQPPPLTDVPELGRDTAGVLAELAGVGDDELVRLRRGEAV
jgi:crotonobetainyl-CoA:carnitine CoA-transferase CaiB-like acyl-CoA transferase